MRVRSRRVALLESLEDRILLSTAVASAAEVSPFAKPAPIHIVGSIPGGEYIVESHQFTVGFVGAGTLGILGPVQMKMTFAENPATRAATLTLTANQGTLTFVDRSKSAGFGLSHLKLIQATGAYAGSSGAGSLVIKRTSPYPGHVLPDVNIFKLTLRA